MSTARANGKNGKRSKRSTVRKGDPPKPVGQLVPGGKGGLIWRGRCANPVAGPGRPPSAIRSRLAGSFDERIPVLEQIADGIVPLREKCSKCGHEPKTDVVAAIPSYDDRLRAMDIMGKLSLTHTGVPIDEVRRRVARTVDIIKEILTPEYSKPVLDALRPVWR